MIDAPDRMFGAFVGKRISLRGNIRKLAGPYSEAARPDLVYFTLTGIGFLLHRFGRLRRSERRP
jgi:hypothetical protein